MQQSVISLQVGRDELIVLPFFLQGGTMNTWCHCYQGDGFPLVVKYSPHLCGHLFKLVLGAVTRFVVGSLRKKLKMMWILANYTEFLNTPTTKTSIHYLPLLILYMVTGGLWVAPADSGHDPENKNTWAEINSREFISCYLLVLFISHPTHDGNTFTTHLSSFMLTCVELRVLASPGLPSVHYCRNKYRYKSRHKQHLF